MLFILLLLLQLDFELNHKGPEDRQAPQASSEGKVDRETTTAIDDDNGAVQALSDFDQLKPEHVEKIRKKFRLTTEQMTNVIQRAQSQNCQFGGGRSLSFNSDDWTPHQQLNAMVYCILLSVLAFTIYRDYGDWIVICFARAFPKEASVLGFQLDRKDIVGSPS